MNDKRVVLVLGLGLTLGACDRGADSRAPDETVASSGGGGADGVSYARVVVPWPDVSKPSGRIGGGENDAAVIVGIESYKHAPAVPGAVDNALAWHRHLVDGLGVPVDRVRLLTDDAATHEAIERAVDAAARTAGASGKVWFVFIGHGAPARTGDDGLLLDVDVRRTVDSMEDRSLHRSKLLARLEASAAQPVVVLDACFSGQTGGDEAIAEGIQPLRLTTLVTPKRAVVLSGAKADQFAGALPGAVRPAFSYFVLGALRGWADEDGDGKVSASEVLGYASRAMGATIQGRQQTPELFGATDVVLAKHGGEKSPDLTEIVAALSRGETVAFNGNGVVLTDLPTLELRALTRDGLNEGVDISSIDMDIERELEEQYLALQSAKKKVDTAKGLRTNDPTGEKQEAAWCELAELGDPNPYRADARNACKQMRTFVEQRRRLVAAMERDWETVVGFVGLKSRTPADKAKVVAAFVKAYGALEERSEVALAVAADSGFATGRLPSWAGSSTDEIRADMDELLAVARRVNTDASARRRTANAAEAARAMGMAYIPGGRFVSETEAPSDENGEPSDAPPVKQEHAMGDFLLDVYEVTVEEYQSCVRAGECEAAGKSYHCNARKRVRNRRHPINCVDFQDADAFCKWAGKRLPTDWEWEWAARGGSDGRTFPWGEAEPTADLVMWESSDGTAPVGSKPRGRSKHGVHDLSGNVWEWTSSTEGEARFLRGGGWRYPGAAGVSASYRLPMQSSARDIDFGFRCAKTET
jgi:formylglycine-generating enzyme required for sulfatase activity